MQINNYANADAILGTLNSNNQPFNPFINYIITTMSESGVFVPALRLIPCNNCGQNLPDLFYFCPYCGKKIIF